MTFASHRTLGATILVSHFTSAHTNIYSKHAEQPYLFCTSQLYYSKNRPLPNANCPLLPQSGMQTAGKFARTDMAKRLRYQDVSRITRSVNFEQWM